MSQQQQQQQVDYNFNLGNHENLKISTKKPQAQEWFNISLSLCYGYNHEEAVRCFQRCIAIDEDCAMAYWGIAFASGINYNNYSSLHVDNCKVAFSNSRKAVQIIEKDPLSFSELEKALILALQHRYSEVMPDDVLVPHQLQFSNAMREVYNKFSNNPNVCAIFAESMMILTPWKLYSNGKTAPHTSEILKVLETAISTLPPHPGIYHLYIHAVELSPNPRQALEVADALGALMPDSGHLLHMPSHIYIQLGMYRKSVLVNMAGIEADKKYLAKEGDDNFYTLYRLHNYHFVVYSAMFEGRYQLAMDHAEELVSQLTPHILINLPDWLETLYSIPLHVLIRFGKWSTILSRAVPSPPGNTPPEFFAVTRAFYHYARAIAHASLNDLHSATLEQELFLAQLPLVPASRYLFNNRTMDILEIAKTMMQGEVAYRAGRYDEAFDLLRRAIKLEEGLDYNEPWGWMQPVRHAAGALMLEQGRVEEAERMYAEDLVVHPENCWALHGLEECLRKQGKVKEADEVKGRLESVRQCVDVPLKASCFCRLSAF